MTFFIITLLIFGAIYFYQKKTGKRLIPKRRPKIKVTEHMGFADDEAPEETDFDDESKMYALGHTDGFRGELVNVLYEHDYNYLMGYDDGEAERES